MSDRDRTESTAGGTGGSALGAPADPERASANTDALTAGAAESAAVANGAALPNTATNRRPGAAPAWSAEEARERDFALIQPGWNVVSSDGEQLGTVHEKGDRWFSLLYGTNDERTMYIPVTYLETVANNRIVLTQPAGLLIDMKLDAPPQAFPGLQHQAVGGVTHDARRGATAGVVAIPAPLDQPAQSPMPPAPAGAEGREAVRQTPAARGAGMPPAAQVIGQAQASSHRDEATVENGAVAESQRSHSAGVEVSSVMRPPLAGESQPQRPVNAQDERVLEFERRSGFEVETQGTSRDMPGGPTHQPGVIDRRSLEPLRTQFGETGTPGEGRERNITDLDLVKNQHPEASAFDSQGATVGRPLAPDEPAVAQRSLPGTAGGGSPRAEDVPTGSVSAPRPK